MQFGNDTFRKLTEPYFRNKTPRVADGENPHFRGIFEGFFANISVSDPRNVLDFHFRAKLNNLEHLSNTVLKEKS